MSLATSAIHITADENSVVVDAVESRSEHCLAPETEPRRWWLWETVSLHCTALASSPQTHHDFPPHDHAQHRAQQHANMARYPTLLHVRRLWTTQWSRLWWWTAVTFLFGSLLFVANGVIITAPLTNTAIQFSSIAADITAVLGAVLFVAGGHTMVADAFRVWAARRAPIVLYEPVVDDTELRPMRTPPPPPAALLRHPQGTATPRRTGSITKTRPRSQDHWTSPFDTLATSSHQSASIPRRMRAWLACAGIVTVPPTVYRDPLYAASLLQLIGCYIYLVSIVLGTRLDMSNETLASATVWPGLTLGSVIFVTASTAFTLFEQHRWWIPEPLSLAWLSGMCNVIGSVGFLMSAVLGFFSFRTHWCALQSCLASLWGSTAFFIASYLQLLAGANPPDTGETDRPDLSKDHDL